MQGVEKESLKELFEITERLKETAEKIKHNSEKLTGEIFDWGPEAMWGSEELVNFIFYRGNDDYPLAHGAYKAENLPVKVGSTFWFHHPDENQMHEFYVDTMETAIGQNKIYMCAFSGCTDEFIRDTMRFIHDFVY